MLLAALPSSSALVEAQLNDPEYAAWVAARPQSPGAGPRVSEWTPDVARLTDIYDRISELVAVMIAANSKGGKFKPPSPAPRPTTELDRLRTRARKARHESLVDEVRAAQARFEQRLADGKCHATTRDGGRCRRSARDGRCWQHQT